MRFSTKNKMNDASHMPRYFRRATALIFVLGVLTLLSFVALILLTTTNGEFKRVANQSNADSNEAAMDSAVLTVQSVLRRDIWGDAPTALPYAERPLANDLPIGSANNPDGLMENNEAFDAPGKNDRWLALAMPYSIGDQNVNVDPLIATPTVEQNVLAWRYVSYVGNDINQPTQPTDRNPFVWAFNSRQPSMAVSNSLIRYNANSLENIPIIQTPPPGYPNPLITGSTTNITIRQAREAWYSAAHQAQLALAMTTSTTYASMAANVSPQFPYFDTNADGQVDLYDADGDGVPDSPLSLVLQTTSDNPNKPKRLYAAVRIIDHNGMLNANTASSLELTDNSLTFDEVTSDLQRRGRRATELFFEDVAHRRDWFMTNRTARLAANRVGNVTTPDPVSYDADIVRRYLLGGVPNFSATPNYFLFGLGEEASLRHRNMLVPYDRRRERASAFTDTASDMLNIDRALPGTLLWCRRTTYDTDSLSYNYDGTQVPRWTRFNSDFQPSGTTTTYEGYSDTQGWGWRDMMQDDFSGMVRRPMLTTVSSEVVPPPNIIAGSIPSSVITPQPSDTAIDIRLRQLWSIGMNWPVLISQTSSLLSDPNVPGTAPANSPTLVQELTVPAEQMPPDWARVLPIDLNMSAVPNGAAFPTISDDVKTDFVRYAAAAMYLALDDVPSYQGVPLSNSVNQNGYVFIDNGYYDPKPNREYLAWQFAANLADFRDSDNDPTIISWPTQPGRYIYGLEKQPFFTEALANLTAGDGSTGGGPPQGPTGTNQPPGSGNPDHWFYAVEFFVPPGWKLNTQNLYVRMPGVFPDPGLLPISSFRQVVTNQFLTLMDGGPLDPAAVTDDEHGSYYILCGDRTYAPPAIMADPDFLAKAYFNNGFELDAIPDLGRSRDGRVELVWSPDGNETNPLNHVLDAIGPSNYVDDTGNNTARAGLMPWAQHDLADATIAPGDQRAFSLRRSTKGWRFTTAWQEWEEGTIVNGPSGTNIPNIISPSLGRPNGSIPSLDTQIPESAWPAMVSAVNADGEPLFPKPNGSGGYTFVPGFQSGKPYEAFDSVADLGRMLMIGAANLSVPPTPAPVAPTPSYLPLLYDLNNTSRSLKRDMSATTMLAYLWYNTANTSLPTDRKDRVAAGRVDFFDGEGVGSSPRTPWTWRLFDYFTTQSSLFDGVDNDGNGVSDLADPLEGYKVLYRASGHVNLNTAPAPVLRSVPWSSLLPTSPDYVYYSPGLGGNMGNPAGDFVGSPEFCWDLPTAIVASRERRSAQLRLPDNAGQLQVVAQTGTSSVGGTNNPNAPVGTGKNAAMSRGAFTSVADLAGMTNFNDAVSGGENNGLFRPDRFYQPDRFRTVVDPNFALANHQVPGVPVPAFGPGSPFSPDYRYRSENNVADYVPIRLPASSVGDPLHAGGIRGRDILLSRVSNLYTTRSDVFTAYIALYDEDGHCVQRSEVTLDRSVCFDEIPGDVNRPRNQVLPKVLLRHAGSYADDTW